MYFEHAALMEELGWENAFFSMCHPKNFDSIWSKYFVDEIEFGHSYSIFDKFKMASKVIYSFEAKNNISSLVDDFKPDIAHLHCIYHHLSPAIIPALKKSGIPVVMTAHDLKIACPAYKMLNETGICEKCNGGSLLNVVKHKCVRGSFAASAIVAIESELHNYLDTYKKYIDRVIVPSLFFMEKFVEWGWPRDKFVYIPNYVDLKYFEPDFSAGDYLIYFGRLAPEKGVATLMKAANLAKTPLKIVGTGPIEAELKVLANELSADIEFLGYQSGESLHNLIRGARAVALPSEWYENAPMSILESFALGKPVIGAEIGGIPEMVINKQTGYLFQSGHVTDLSRVLKNFWQLSDLEVSAMGQSARDFCCHHI
nr:glycosyltransferase family 4 protein [Deefgea sp. CFH1-16]